MKLNKEQKEAVEYNNGPLLIIAGAGTGKTKVITERISHIVKNKWASPDNILALTFTEKAAQEMQERVDLALPINAIQPEISTFHSFADKILKDEGIYIGLDSNFTLMTQSETYIFFRKHLFDFPLKIFRPLGNPTKFITAILTHFSRLQDEDVTVEKYLKFAKNLPTSNDEEKERKEEILELALTYKKYTELKIENSKLDFGDLINLCLKLFRKKANILKKYHEKYKYILVDEFQDTNFSQNTLINLIVKGGKDGVCNLTVVGDDDQAIYKFRGAAISNILQFKKSYPSAKSVVLKKNYRSAQTILDCAYSLIKNNNPYRLEVTEGIDKKLFSQIESKSGEIKVVRTRTANDEADYIADTIEKLVKNGLNTETIDNLKGQVGLFSENKGLKYSDIAILTRANAHADEIIGTLRYRGIPYKLGGSKSLYQRPEVAVLISFLKSLLDYSDEVSMYNVLCMEEWKLTPREIVEIVKKARSEKISTYEIIEKIAGIKAGSGDVEKIKVPLSAESVSNLVKLVKIYDKCIKKVTDGKSPGDILFYFFEMSGIKDKYMENVEGDYVFASENTQKYFNMLNNYWKNNQPTSVYEYLDYLNYSIEIGEAPSVDQNSFDEYDGVNILTIHGSKGLEFPVVFVANMVTDRFPSRDRKDAIPIPEELINEVLPVGGESVEHLMEERRLAYVAYTRAKESLFLTGAMYYGEAKRQKKLSPFVFESIDEKSIENIEKEKSVVEYREEKSPVDLHKLGLSLPNIFSYTQLHTYDVCPMQYKYQYVLKLPTPPNSATSFGTTIHSTLKQLYENLKVSSEGLGMVSVLTLDELIEIYKKNWVSVGFENKKHEKIRYEDGRKVMEEYYLKTFNVSEKPISIEKSFDFAIDDFKVRGRVDRIDLIKEEGGIKYVEIIDYKTGRERDEKEASKEWQLPFYAYVVEKLMGLKVLKASYIYVEANKKVSVPVDDMAKAQTLDHIKDIVGKIRKGNFEVPSGHDCKYCNFREVIDDVII